MPAAADNQVRDGSFATTNYGTGTNMEVKWVGAPGYTRETYLRFNLTGVGGASGISSGKVRLFGRMLDTKVAGMVVELRPVSNGSWNESTLTWNTRPAAGSTPVAIGNIAGTTGRYYEFDVTNYLKQQKAAGATSVAFALRAQSTGEGWSGFTSDESTTNKPQLVVSQAQALSLAASPTQSVSGGGSNLTPAYEVPTLNALPAGATADQAHFAYKTVRGNGTIIARVDRSASNNSFAESGIMIRTDLGAGAPFVDLTLSGAAASLDYRTAAGLASKSGGNVLVGGASAWLKLVRDGNSFAGYISATGAENSWQLVGTAGVVMPTFAHFGLEVAGSNGTNSSTFTNVSVRPSNPLGGNLNMQTDRIEDHPIVDLVKLTRGFFNVAGRTDSMGKVALANTDASGWPTEDFSVTVVDHSEWNVPAEAGVYRMSFTGSAGTSVAALPGSGVTLNKTGFDAGSGVHTYDVTVPAGVLKVGFNFTATGGQVRNLKVLQPGYELATYPTYTNRYLNLLRDLRPNTIRLMDFTHTLAHPVANWADRPQTSDATWGRVDLRRTDRLQPFEGIPWEQGIELANALGSNVWISVPHLATDDYVRNLATLLKDTLRSDLNIFVEHSNEVWNAGYEQNTYNRRQAVQEVIAEARAGRQSNLNYDNRSIDFSKPDETNPNADTWGDRRHARRTKEISEIFRGVWTTAGAEDPTNTRVRTVLGGQVSTLSRFDNELDYVNRVFGAPKNFFYAIGVAPYFGLNKYTNVTATKDQILEGMNLSITASWQNGTALDTTLSKAKAAGLRMVGYEGGPDTFGALNIASKRAASLDPQMKGIVERYLNIWYSKGGDQFNWYTLGARSFNTEFGTWSITENANVFNQPKQLGFKTIRDALPPNGVAGAYVFA